MESRYWRETVREGMGRVVGSPLLVFVGGPISCGIATALVQVWGFGMGEREALGPALLGTGLGLFVVLVPSAFVVLRQQRNAARRDARWLQERCRRLGWLNKLENDGHALRGIKEIRWTVGHRGEVEEWLNHLREQAEPVAGKDHTLAALRESIGSMEGVRKGWPNDPQYRVSQNALTAGLRFIDDIRADAEEQASKDKPAAFGQI